MIRTDFPSIVLFFVISRYIPVPAVYTTDIFSADIWGLFGMDRVSTGEIYVLAYAVDAIHIAKNKKYTRRMCVYRADIWARM
jgi:hypothetical protein